MLSGSLNREGANVDFCELPTTSRGAGGTGHLDYSTTASTFYSCMEAKYTFDLSAVPLLDKQASHYPICSPLFFASRACFKHMSDTFMTKKKKKSRGNLDGYLFSALCYQYDSIHFHKYAVFVFACEIYHIFVSPIMFTN